MSDWPSTWNFTLAELTRTGTGLPNVPNPSEEAALRYLTEFVLQPLRKRVGPLQVTSGFRCGPVNLAVGGAKGSQHSKGEAVDVIPLRMTRDALFALVVDLMLAKKLPVDQMVTYRDHPHLHLSATAKRAPRYQILVSDGGKYAAYTTAPGAFL